MSLDFENFFKDSDCDANIELFQNAIANGYKIISDKQQFKYHLQMLGDTFNKVNNKIQQIKSNCEKLQLSTEDIQIKNFVENIKQFCNGLKKYLSNIKYSKDNESVEKSFVSLKFYEDKFLKEAKKTEDYIKERQVYEEKGSYKPLSNIQKLSKVIYPFVKGIWTYKINLYIAGLLTYNTYIYVFPREVEVGLNLFIKLCTVGVYTLASNTVAATKFLEKVVAVQISLIKLFFKLSGIETIFNSTFGKIIPERVNDTAVLTLEYGYIYFARNYFRYVAKTVGIAVIVTKNMSLELGIKIVGKLWEEAKEHANNIALKLYTLGQITVEFINKHSTPIISSVWSFFSDFIGNTIVIPILEYFKKIPSNFVKSFWEDGKEKKDTETLVGNIAKSMQTYTTQKLLTQPDKKDKEVVQYIDYKKTKKIIDKFNKQVEKNYEKVNITNDFISNSLVPVDKGNGQMVLKSSFSEEESKEIQNLISDEPEEAQQQYYELVSHTFNDIFNITNSSEPLKKLNEQITESIEETLAKTDYGPIYSDFIKIGNDANALDNTQFYLIVVLFIIAFINKIIYRKK